MKEDYQEKILTFLGQETRPTDVEKIRTSCGIGNWNTALTHCFELLVQGKIQGQKTSKGWVFWTNQQTRLHPWQEAIGNYKDLKISEDIVTLTLTITKTLNITYPKNTPEAQTLIQALKKTPKGTKITLLKTDIPEKPLIIRTFCARPVAHKFFCKQLLVRSSLLFAALKMVAFNITLWYFELRSLW